MAKYCGNCGRELPDEAMYCPNCGQEYVPRYKADHYSNGSSDDEFKGPFDDFDNRSSRNPFESSSKKSSSKSSGNPNKSNSSNNSETFPWRKVCIAAFVLLLLFLAISYFAGLGNDSSSYDTSIIEDSSENISSNPPNTKYLYDRNRDEGRGNMDTNEPYKISIDENAYFSGIGEAQLIDSNHSYNLESDNFTITDYETYYVNVDDNDWYVLDIFKCKFDTPSQRQVYSTDMDDGDPIIIYGGKGEYYGYGIIIPSSSDDSTYKNIGFLESIFHYKEE